MSGARPKHVTACIALNGLLCVFAISVSLIAMPTYAEMTSEGQTFFSLFFLGTLLVASSTLLSFRGRTKAGGLLSFLAGLFFMPLLGTYEQTSDAAGSMRLMQFMLAMIPLATGISITKYAFPKKYTPSIPKQAQVPKKDIYRPKTPTTTFTSFVATSDPNVILQAHRNGKWDVVLGFDVHKFLKEVKSEQEYQARLELNRNKRENECAKKGASAERLLVAVAEAYANLITPERRTMFHLDKSIDEIFHSWRVVEEEDIKKAVTVKLHEIFAQPSYGSLEWIQRKENRREIEEKILDTFCFDIGQRLSSKNRRDESLPFLRRAVELHRDDPHMNHWLGSTLLNLEKWREALSYLEVAQKKRGDGIDHFLFGYCLCRLERWCEAVPHLREAVRRNPDQQYRQTLAAAESRCRYWRPR